MAAGGGCLGDAHHLGHELVEVCALVGEALLVARAVEGLQRRLERLVLLLEEGRQVFGQS